MSSLYTSTGLSSAIATYARNAPRPGNSNTVLRDMYPVLRVSEKARPIRLEPKGPHAPWSDVAVGRYTMFDVFAAPAEHSYSKTWAELHSNYASLEFQLRVASREVV